MTGAVVAGAVANKAHNGGETWVRLSWVMGLRSLGFDVHLVEQLDALAPPGAGAYFAEVVRMHGIDATLLDAGGQTLQGCSPAELADLCAEAALLVNLSGHLRLAELRDRCRCRVYVDLDPGYTQVWHRDGLISLAGHDHWYSVGLDVGQPACRVPTSGIPWRPVLPPVVLADWPDASTENTESAPEVRLTTIASWRGAAGTIEVDGRAAGAKAREFRRLLPLPERVAATVEVALDIHPGDDADRCALMQHGWQLADPADVAADPAAFRSYVQQSTGELSVAQEVYVSTACGWFSDRTTRYLASGRPAIVQDTGFGRHLPVGEGLLTFTDLDGAVRAVEALLRDPGSHGRAARALAEDRFASDVVLGRLCEEIDVAP